MAKITVRFQSNQALIESPLADRQTNPLTAHGFDGDTPSEVIIATSANEYNEAIRHLRGDSARRSQPEYLAGREKIQERVVIEIEGKQYGLPRVVQAGMGVGISRGLSFDTRDQGYLGVNTIVGISALSRPQVIVPHFSTVNFSGLVDEDCRLHQSDTRLQKQLYPDIPTAVNILMAARGGSEKEGLPYARAAIDAGTNLLFCGAGDPGSVARLLSQKKYQEGQEVQSAVCPIFHESVLMSRVLGASFIPYGIVPPIIEMENPAEAGGHEGRNRPEALHEKFAHHAGFFQKARQALEKLAEKIEAGKVEWKAELSDTQKADLARQVRAIKLCASGGIQTHEDACERLGAGADMVMIGTSLIHSQDSGKYTDIGHYDEEFSRAILGGFDDKGNIITDPLKERLITTIKSPAGYPANAVASPLTHQYAVLQTGRHYVDSVAPYLQRTALRDIPENDRRALQFIFEQGEAIPGWHHSFGDFYLRIAERTRDCAAKCLQQCGLTEKLGNKASPACILGPLTAGYFLGHTTEWKGRAIPNRHLGLVFSGAKGPVFETRQSVAEIMTYLTSGNIPSGAILNARRSTHDNSVFELWNQA